MTVSYLRVMQCTQTQTSRVPLSQYMSGFQDCAQETAQYLSEHCNLNPDVIPGLYHHLSDVRQKFLVGNLENQRQCQTNEEQTAVSSRQNRNFPVPMFTSTPKQRTQFEQDHVLVFNDSEWNALPIRYSSNHSTERFPDRHKYLIQKCPRGLFDQNEEPAPDQTVWRPW